jgi:uncharacterized protein YybS (DUF2232 family)
VVEKMEQAQLIGYGVIALSTILGFIVTVLKFIQPINELRIVIQELKDCINNIIKDNARHTERLDKQRDQIEQLQKDVVEIKLMMNVYHKEDH